MTRRGLGPGLTGRKPRLVTWGELLWDVFPKTAHLGGSAANVAVHAALLGAESHLVSAVGDDPLGRDAVSKMAQAGVNTSGVAIHRDSPTGRVRVTFEHPEEHSEPRFEIEENVAWDRIPADQPIAKLVGGADAFCFSTLAQRTPLMRYRLGKLLDEIRSRPSPSFGGSRNQKHQRPLCILDLNLRPPFTDQATIIEAARRCDVLKLNEHEAEWVCQSFQCENATKYLLHRFPIRLVALTRGAAGATLSTRNLTCTAMAPPARGGDPVGAGDAFVAALSVALVTGASVPRALEIANRHGAWVASRAGAMPHLNRL